ncbi:hypothetical protein ACTXG5_18760 [Mycobacterium sp. Dal123C01]|uniref:hypothetical protein n=1 Tax=Mycobacterium sp. Dal123C01 TaxID=3457577 RepID=UPI00403E74EB
MGQPSDYPAGPKLLSHAELRASQITGATVQAHRGVEGAKVVAPGAVSTSTPRNPDLRHP